MILSADDIQTLVKLLAPSHRSAEERDFYLGMAFHGDAVRDAIGPDATSPQHYVQRLFGILDSDKWLRDEGGRVRPLAYLEPWATNVGGDAALHLGPLLARLRSVSAAQSMDDAIRQHLNALEQGAVRTMLYVALGGRIAELRARREAPGLSAFELAAGPLALSRTAQHTADDTATPDPVDDVASCLVAVQRGVLLGVPGAGKTFTLLKAAALHARAWSTNPDAGGRIPVFVPLRSFHGETQDTSEAWNPVVFEDFVRAQAPALTDHFDRLAHEQRLVFLVDALNEMPRKAPNTGRALLPEVLTYLRTADRFVVSCRVREYENELDPLRPLERVELLSFDPPQIEAAIHARFESGDQALGTRLWEALGGSDGMLRFWNAVVEHGEGDRFWELRRGVPSHTDVVDDREWERMHAVGAMELCRTPLLLALVCEVYEAEQSLPASRFALLDRVIQGGLSLAAERSAAFGTPWPDRRRRGIRAVLIALTRSMQAAGVTETAIELPDADPTDPLDAHACLLAAADAGIVELGGSTLRFRHQQLQDYFGAYVLHAAMESGADPHEYLKVDAAWWDVGAWREATTLLVELVASRGEGSDGHHRVAQWLSRVNPELALESLDVDADCGPALGAEEVMQPATRQTILDAVRPRLVEPHPGGRASAYRALSRLDADDRTGVGLRPDGLPDVLSPEAWCHVPAGPFVMGSDADRPDERPAHTIVLPDFWIARYPVTYAQFGAFVAAPDGYGNDEFWKAPPELQRPDSPWSPRWPIGNHPAESVSWYEAVAYCRWLSARLSHAVDRPVEIRLPSEAEWEKAARGPDGRVYPWGTAYEPGRANIDETWSHAAVGPYNLGRTSAVGLYRQDNAYGADDMAGNVWEWMRSLWGENIAAPDAAYRYPYDPNDVAREDLGAPRACLRVVRGGSWGYDHVNARAACRYGARPDDRVSGVGFRLVVSSPISS